jgi:hypothetical protein
MDIDEFASGLFEEAKRHLEKAVEADAAEAKRAYCHAALLLGICALEAHVNSLSTELALRPGLSVSEQSLLLEKEYSFAKGRFGLTNRLKMYRLTDRIQFIFARFTKNERYTSEPWWGGLKNAIETRNDIVHPKDAADLTESDVRRALSSVLSCLNALYRSVFKKRYPAYGRGLSSELQF